MKLSDARLVNKILTEAVQGIGPQSFYGHNLFPRVDVTERGGTTLVFKTDTSIKGDLIRAPGTKRKSFSPTFEGAPYAIQQRSLAAKVTVEEAEEALNGAGIDLAMIGIGLAKAELDERVEKAQAALARNAANYSTGFKETVTAKFSDPSTNFLAVIAEKAALVTKKTRKARKDLTWFISAPVFNAIEFRADMQEKLKFTNQTWSPEFLAKQAGVGKVVVADSVDSETGNFIWGNDCILAYVAVGSRSNAQPSYGYTYTLKGSPLVQNGYEDESEDSWYFPVNVEAQPVLAWDGAGYLFKDAI